MKQSTLRLGTVTMSHEPDTKRLVAAFFAGDDIGAVIRCHVEVEWAAVHALDALTGNRWRRPKGRYQYLSDKLNLLYVLGVEDRIIEAGKKLNEHRRNLAHGDQDEIQEQQMLDLLHTVRRFEPRLKDSFVVRFLGEKTFDGTFNECTTRQKYVVCCGALMMRLGAIPAMIRLAVVDSHRADVGGGASEGVPHVQP